MIRPIAIACVLVVSACSGAGNPAGTAAAPTIATSAAAALAFTPANSVPQTFQWTKAPPAYPAGAEISVVEGDTSKPGLYTLRFRFPDGYALPPHSHPIEEHVTVLQGTFSIGRGTIANRDAAVDLPAGSFLLIPSRTEHYVFIKGVTIVQVHGLGPGGIVYVNPADDPRK